MKEFKILEELDLDRPVIPYSQYLDMSYEEEFDTVLGKYPEYPRTFLIHNDTHRRGVMFTKEAIEKAQDEELNIRYQTSLLFQYQHFYPST